VVSHTWVFKYLKHDPECHSRKPKRCFQKKNIALLGTKRISYENHRDTIHADEVISVDETSFYTRFSPRYAWSPKKSYVHVLQQKHQSKRLTLASAMTSHGVHPQEFVGGSCNSRIFAGLNISMPTCGSRKHVLMDNVRFHHTKAVLDAISKRNLVPLYCAPYPPDYNPIEMYFGYLKNQMRRGLSFSDVVPTGDDVFQMVSSFMETQLWRQH
jgi:transposase